MAEDVVRGVGAVDESVVESLRLVQGADLRSKRSCSQASKGSGDPRGEWLPGEEDDEELLKSLEADLAGYDSSDVDVEHSARDGGAGVPFTFTW